MAYIYKITNKVNGKSYIGKTQRTLEVRFNEHIRDISRPEMKRRPLYRAFIKYGVENFEMSLIEEVSDDSVNDKEIFWINYFNTYHNGYNATKGGEGTLVVDHSKILSLAKDHTSAEISEKLNCDVSTVLRICRENRIKCKKSDTGKNRRTAVVLLENNLLFSSAYEASLYFKKNFLSNHIGSCVSGKRKKAGGFSWVKASDHLTLVIDVPCGQVG